jgi:hypothetical protein
MPGHFTTLWKSWSTSTPSGQLVREAAGTSTKLARKVLIYETGYLYIMLQAVGTSARQRESVK